MPQWKVLGIVWLKLNHGQISYSDSIKNLLKKEKCKCSFSSLCYIATAIKLEKHKNITQNNKIKLRAQKYILKYNVNLQQTCQSHTTGKMYFLNIGKHGKTVTKEKIKKKKLSYVLMLATKFTSE